MGHPIDFGDIDDVGDVAPRLTFRTAGDPLIEVPP